MPADVTGEHAKTALLTANTAKSFELTGTGARLVISNPLSTDPVYFTGPVRLASLVTATKGTAEEGVVLGGQAVVLVANPPGSNVVSVISNGASTVTVELRQ